MVWVAYMVGMGRDSGRGRKGGGGKEYGLDCLYGRYQWRERVEEGGGIGKGLRVIVGALYTT